MTNPLIAKWEELNRPKEEPKPQEIKTTYTLERQIQEYKKTEKFLTEYEVTFRVRFNPETHKESDLCDPESFSHWLCDVIPDEIFKSFKFFKPEDVGDFVAVEMMQD